MVRYRLFKLSLLTLGVYSHFGYAGLNLKFIHGTHVVPSVMTTDSAYPQGRTGLMTVQTVVSFSVWKGLRVTSLPQMKATLWR